MRRSRVDKTENHTYILEQLHPADHWRLQYLGIETYGENKELAKLSWQFVILTLISLGYEIFWKSMLVKYFRSSRQMHSVLEESIYIHDCQN